MQCKYFADSECRRHRSTFYLIFEYCEHDLAGILSNSAVTFNLGEIKQVVKQMLNGLYFIHQNKVNNILTIPTNL